MWTTKQLQSKVMEPQNNILYQIASEGLQDFFFCIFWSLIGPYLFTSQSHNCESFRSLVSVVLNIYRGSATQNDIISADIMSVLKYIFFRLESALSANVLNNYASFCKIKIASNIQLL